MNLIEKTLSTTLASRFADQVEFRPAQVTAIARELGIKDGEAYKYFDEEEAHLIVAVCCCSFCCWD